MTLDKAIEIFKLYRQHRRRQDAMTLDEAIEGLNACMSETEKILYPESLKSHKLGIAALKFTQEVRIWKSGWKWKSLPGETPD